MKVRVSAERLMDASAEVIYQAYAQAHGGVEARAGANRAG
jgi:hypothetical protein